jgi:hypothetical protein
MHAVVDSGEDSGSNGMIIDVSDVVTFGAGGCGGPLGRRMREVANTVIKIGHS